MCNIVSETHGLTHLTDGACTIFKVFNLFLDDEIYDTMCTFTAAEGSHVFKI